MGLGQVGFQWKARHRRSLSPDGMVSSQAILFLFVGAPGISLKIHCP
jgi:hypothetical protein